MTVWLLGDQLTTEVGPLASGADRVLMIEAHGFARRHRYHPQKLVLVFSTMRHVRDRLREEGYEVSYLRGETFAEGLESYLEEHPGDGLTLMEPASHGAGERLAELVEDAGGTLERVENECFLCPPDVFDEEFGEPPYRHEPFYRFMRRRTGYLMDGDEPEGGEWNYDEDNRETPPEDWEPPAVPRFEPDELTCEVLEWVDEEFPDAWGSSAGFAWPVTREEALEALSHFVEARLPEFGPYQDVMLRGEWALSHSLLSSSLNLGLLHPTEVCEAALDAYEERELPIASVEGFLRQVIGWREFTRHVYRRAMPGMAGANQLEATEDLPQAYYTGETGMTCLSECVNHVYERGYAHHIERLMVLSNFALVYGANPRELNEWFHFGFVDAYHWVTTPNVIGMGSFGTDALSSKPYASSANYIDGMSDFCTGCRYDADATVGEDACPFNALYWDFLARNEERLRENYRMGLMYSHVDRKRGDELAAIRERTDEIRELGASGEL